jgi:D-glycerate 3-kinase
MAVRSGAGAVIPGHTQLIRQLGWPEPSLWHQHWQRRHGLNLAREIWPAGVDPLWISGLALPLLSLLERAAASGQRHLIGLSALPGCGKSTLGAWLQAAAAELALPIAVVSLDDFYWPAAAMERCMRGNPWQAPRGLPGSHDLALLQESLASWRQHGGLRVPQFDRALREGRGDRAGWRQLQAQVVLLEGWFLGVDPWSLEQERDAAALAQASPLEPTAEELAYRPRILAALRHYTPLWDQLACLWHLQAPSTAATVRWKQQQEALLRRRSGVGMEAALFDPFVRMLQLAILPTALQSIPRAHTVIQLDAERRIEAIAVRSPSLTGVPCPLLG